MAHQPNRENKAEQFELYDNVDNDGMDNFFDDRQRTDRTDNTFDIDAEDAASTTDVLFVQETGKGIKTFHMSENSAYQSKNGKHYKTTTEATGLEIWDSQTASRTHTDKPSTVYSEAYTVYSPPMSIAEDNEFDDNATYQTYESENDNETIIENQTVNDNESENLYDENENENENENSGRLGLTRTDTVVVHEDVDNNSNNNNNSSSKDNRDTRSKHDKQRKRDKHEKQEKHDSKKKSGHHNKDHSSKKHKHRKHRDSKHAHIEVNSVNIKSTQSTHPSVSAVSSLLNNLNNRNVGNSKNVGNNMNSMHHMSNVNNVNNDVNHKHASSNSGNTLNVTNDSEMEVASHGTVKSSLVTILDTPAAPARPQSAMTPTHHENTATLDNLEEVYVQAMMEKQQQSSQVKRNSSKSQSKSGAQRGGMVLHTTRSDDLYDGQGFAYYSRQKSNTYTNYKSAAEHVPSPQNRNNNNNIHRRNGMNNNNNNNNEMNGMLDTRVAHNLDYSASDEGIDSEQSSVSNKGGGTKQRRLSALTRENLAKMADINDHGNGIYSDIEYVRSKQASMRNNHNSSNMYSAGYDAGFHTSVEFGNDRRYDNYNYNNNNTNSRKHRKQRNIHSANAVAHTSGPRRPITGQTINVTSNIVKNMDSASNYNGISTTASNASSEERRRRQLLAARYDMGNIMNIGNQNNIINEDVRSRSPLGSLSEEHEDNYNYNERRNIQDISQAQLQTHGSRRTHGIQTQLGTQMQPIQSQQQQMHSQPMQQQMLQPQMMQAPQMMQQQMMQPPQMMAMQTQNNNESNRKNNKFAKYFAIGAAVALVIVVGVVLVPKLFSSGKQKGGYGARYGSTRIRRAPRRY